jgi:hypothetical protein
MSVGHNGSIPVSPSGKECLGRGDYGRDGVPVFGAPDGARAGVQTGGAHRNGEVRTPVDLQQKELNVSRDLKVGSFVDARLLSVD